VIPILSAILGLAALRGTVEISNRVQVAARDGVAAAGPTLDVETSPDVKLGVRSRRWELTADYAPRFTGTLLGVAPQSYVLQQSRLGARFQGVRASIELYQDAGYGRLSLLALLADPGAMPGTPRLAALPKAEIIDYAWSRTGLVSRLAASRRWGFTLAADSSLSGGVGESARAAMPFQTALHGGISAEYAASRKDHLITSLDASRALFSSGWDDTLIESKLSWRHDLRRDTTATLAGGIGWASSYTDVSRVARASAVPIAEAKLTHRPRASSIDLGLTVRLAPIFDGLSGRIDERVESLAAVTWTPARALAIQGQLGVARSIPWSEGEALSLGFGGVTITYRVNDILQLDTGARSAWAGGRGVDTPAQWMAFAGATLRIPTLRF
jgi:hypothetical protein